MSISARRFVGGFAWMLLAAAPALAQNAEGMFVSVSNPITTDTYRAIERQIDARCVVADGDPRKPGTIIFDFNPGDKPASTAEVGVCRDLAAYIKKVQTQYRVATVAFVHGKVSGHTILPVLACGTLVMSKDSTIGEIGALQKPDEAQYRFYFGKDDRFVLVQKMYDPNVKLRSGTGKGDPAIAGKKIYIDENTEREKIAGEPTPVKGVQDNAIGLYNTATAIELGLCSATVNTRAEVAERFSITSIREDPIHGAVAEPFKWTLKGNVDENMREAVNRIIRDVRKKSGNVLILVLNCEGNDLIAARGLADDLIKAQSGNEPLQIIGFIPSSAPAAGTVVALGCTDIVMYKPKAGVDANEAEIGDFENYLKSASSKDADANLASIRELAVNQGYPGILIDGMFKKDLVIVRAVGKKDTRHRRLVSSDEFEKIKEEWKEDKIVKPAGMLLKLNSTAAAEYGLARLTVEGTDVKDVTAAYGYKEAKDPEPGWLDKFAEFLRLPVVTVLLVVIGFTGLILELKMPGLTVPGIIAALCFILVFWAHSRFSGQTFVLALLLFLLGLVLVGLEIFVLPGFGVCGICGILCMLAGLGLVTLDKIPQTGNEWGDLGIRVSRYTLALLSAIVLAIFVARYLPNLPGGNRLVLDTPPSTAGDVTEALPGAVQAAELLGAIGTTNTALRPAGVVKFAEQFVDVVSDGGFIPAGTRVQVIQVEGTRIVVKEV